MLGFIIFLSIFFLMRPSDGINCYQCYRLEECPIENCTSIYSIVNTTYRDNFLIEKDTSLPICPDLRDDSGWRKLQVDGNCGKHATKFQPCSVSHFQVSGLSLGSSVLNGVFLGCPKLKIIQPIQYNYLCSTYRQFTDNYKNGIIKAKYRYKELMLKFDICNVNCTNELHKCTLCYSDACIHPNNTLIVKEFGNQPLPISLAILVMTCIVIAAFLGASYCSTHRLDKLHLYTPADGDFYSNLNKK